MLVKHGKYVAAGAAGCYWTQLPEVVRSVLAREGGWVRCVFLSPAKGRLGIASEAKVGDPTTGQSVMG